MESGSYGRMSCYLSTAVFPSWTLLSCFLFNPSHKYTLGRVRLRFFTQILKLKLHVLQV
jgi:hypothetical protein